MHARVDLLNFMVQSRNYLNPHNVALKKLRKCLRKKITLLSRERKRLFFEGSNYNHLLRLQKRDAREREKPVEGSKEKKGEEREENKALISDNYKMNEKDFIFNSFL